MPQQQVQVVHQRLHLGRKVAGDLLRLAQPHGGERPLQSGQWMQRSQHQDHHRKHEPERQCAEGDRCCAGEFRGRRVHNDKIAGDGGTNYVATARKADLAFHRDQMLATRSGHQMPVHRAIGGASSGSANLVSHSERERRAEPSGRSTCQYNAE